MHGLIGCRVRGFLLFALMVSFTAGAQTKTAERPEQMFQRGQRVANAVATITGTAISPLLGVSVLGAYSYFRTPEAERRSLPFYCSPLFWIPLVLLLTLVFLKDTVGSVLPILKKPLDAVEVLIVNKAALLFAVLPVVWFEAADLQRAAAPIASLVLPAAYDTAPSATAAGMSLPFLLGTMIA